MNFRSLKIQYLYILGIHNFACTSQFYKRISQKCYPIGEFKRSVWTAIFPPQTPLDPQKLSIEADPLSKLGVCHKNHQHTAPQNGVRLQNSSTYSPPKGGLPLKFITQKRSSSRFHQPKGIPSTKKGPLGTISMDTYAKHISNLTTVMCKQR